jgi:hypothetical protein
MSKMYVAKDVSKLKKAESPTILMTTVTKFVEIVMVVPYPVLNKVHRSFMVLPSLRVTSREISLFSINSSSVPRITVPPIV